MGVPTFQVASVTIKGPGRNIRAARERARGRWHVTAAVNAPANAAKIESLLSALSSLRVVDGEKGFVADNVKDFAPFGLAGSPVTVELTTTVRSEGRSSCTSRQAGSRPSGSCTSAKKDQDDVVVVDAKPLSEIPASTSPCAARSPTSSRPR